MSGLSQKELSAPLEYIVVGLSIISNEYETIEYVNG